MKNTALLLRSYEFVYGLAVVIAIVLAASGHGVASVFSASGIWAVAFLALIPLGLVVLNIVLRLREFRRYAHIPGPEPSFILGNLRSLLLHELVPGIARCWSCI